MPNKPPPPDPRGPLNPIIEGETESDRRQRSREIQARRKELEAPTRRFDSLVGLFGVKPRVNREDKRQQRDEILRKEFSPENIAKARALRGY